MIKIWDNALLHQRIHYALLGLLFLLFPFFIQGSNIVLVLLSCHWAIWTRFRIKKKIMENIWFLAPPLLLGAAYVLSLLHSEHIVIGLHSIERKLPFFLLPLLVGTLPIRYEKKKIFIIFLISILVTLFVYISLSIINFKGQWYTRLYESSLGFLDFSFHPSFFSLYLILFILILTDYYKDARLTVVQVFGLFAFILFLLVYIVLLASKFYILMLPLVFIYVVFQLFKKTPASLKFSVLLFLPILAWIGYKTSAKKRLEEMSKTEYSMDAQAAQFNAVNTRMAILACTWDVAKDNFVYGAGVGDLPDLLLASYRKHNFLLGVQEAYHPHNEYLVTLIDVGIVGLLILMFLYAFGFLAAVKTANFNLFFLMLFFLFGGLVDIVLSIHKGVILFGFFYPLFALHFDKSSSEAASVTGETV